MRKTCRTTSCLLRLNECLGEISQRDISRCLFVSIQCPVPDGTDRDGDCRLPRARRLQKTSLQYARGHENTPHGTTCCWNNKRAGGVWEPYARKAEFETHRTRLPLEKNP